MRFVAAAFEAFRPFGRLWLVGAAIALFLTFGLGGGTPSTPPWLILKAILLGALLLSLLVELAVQIRDRLRRGSSRPSA